MEFTTSQVANSLWHVACPNYDPETHTENTLHKIQEALDTILSHGAIVSDKKANELPETLAGRMTAVLLGRLKETIVITKSSEWRVKRAILEYLTECEESGIIELRE